MPKIGTVSLLAWAVGRRWMNLASPDMTSLFSSSIRLSSRFSPPAWLPGRLEVWQLHQNFPVLECLLRLSFASFIPSVPYSTTVCLATIGSRMQISLPPRRKTGKLLPTQPATTCLVATKNLREPNSTRMASPTKWQVCTNSHAQERGRKPRHIPEPWDRSLCCCPVDIPAEILHSVCVGTSDNLPNSFAFFPGRRPPPRETEADSSTSHRQDLAKRGLL